MVYLDNKVILGYQAYTWIASLYLDNNDILGYQDYTWISRL